MTPLQIIISIIFLAFAFLASGICANTFYVAFIKKKDERLQLIVTQSMAQSFIIVFILQTVQYIIKFITAGEFQIKSVLGISLDPAILSIVILSIILLINRKKHSV